MRILKAGALAIFGVFVLALILGLTYRAYRQHVNAEAIAIRTPNGIEEGMYVEIGGIEQWIQIRGRDRAYPVVLLLNGGPGASWLRATHVLTPWEEHFVFVQWDQRGSGRTYGRTGDAIAPTMTIDRMVEDGIELAEFLKDHLDKDKIILLGHSWGSILGVHLAKQRPELFYSFVGAGQAVNLLEDFQAVYDLAVDTAVESGNERALASLESLGRPPYEAFEEYQAFWQAMNTVFPNVEEEIPPIPGSGLGAPDYSIKDFYDVLRGMQLSLTALYPSAVKENLRNLGPDFEIPVFIFHGEKDLQSLEPSVRAYFDEIEAPHKEFVSFPGEGHFAFFLPEFLDEMVTRVRPLAMPR